MKFKNYSKKEIKKQIEDLENLANKASSSAHYNYNDYYDIYKKIESFQWSVPVYPLDGEGMLRVRIPDESSTESMEEGKFKKFKDIHHIPEEDENEDLIKGFGRFDSPYRSRFYATSTLPLAYFESSKNWRNPKNKIIPFETVTTGYWDLKEEILAAIIMGPKDDYGTNQDFHKFKNTFLKVAVEEYYELYDYLTKKFTEPYKTEKDYYLTAALANYIFDQKFEHPKVNVDCIIYPTGLPNKLYKQMNGMNFCIHPRIVNTKLVLRKVTCERWKTTIIDGKKNGRQISQRIETENLDHKNRIIKW